MEIEAHWHNFHVLKRPGVDTFLQKMGEIYEIVVFTASLSKVSTMIDLIALESTERFACCSSMQTQSLISWIYIRQLRIVCSAKAATVTRVTTSRYGSTDRVLIPLD